MDPRARPLAGTVELDEATVVDEPVDDGCGQLVVPEHRTPLAKLDVGRHDRAPPLVAVAHHLEQQPRAFCVERHAAEPVEDDEFGPAEVFQRRLGSVLAVDLIEDEGELGGHEEAHGPAGLRVTRHPVEVEVPLAPLTTLEPEPPHVVAHGRLADVGIGLVTETVSRGTSNFLDISTIESPSILNWRIEYAWTC